MRRPLLVLAIDCLLGRLTALHPNNVWCVARFKQRNLLPGALTVDRELDLVALLGHRHLFGIFAVEEPAAVFLRLGLTRDDSRGKPYRLIRRHFDAVLLQGRLQSGLGLGLLLATQLNVEAY